MFCQYCLSVASGDTGTSYIDSLICGRSIPADPVNNVTCEKSISCALDINIDILET